MIEFKSARGDGDVAVDDPIIAGFVYLHLVDDEESCISGYVRPHVRSLVKAAPDLLEAAQAAQCSCSVRERDSGHRVECWMPALSAAVAKATQS